MRSSEEEQRSSVRSSARSEQCEEQRGVVRSSEK
jgi:hypothetical protein